MDNRIDKKFQQLKREKRKAFIPFITAGYPSLKATEKLVLALEQNGADIVEIGIPFSDPLADGPTIQDASFQSLKKGITLNQIFDCVLKVRKTSNIPIALMTYYNPVFHFGEKKFITKAKQCGVDGLIIPDLPPEEALPLRKYAKRQKIATIFFLSPTTTMERMKKIVKASTGFIYFVSIAGVTGARKTLPQALLSKVKKAKNMTSKPVCVGFGVSTSNHVKEIARVADGVIVGSAIIKEMKKSLHSKNMVNKVGRFVRTLSCGLKIK